MNFDPLAPLNPMNGIGLLSPKNLDPRQGVKSLGQFLGIGGGGGDKTHLYGDKPRPMAQGFRNYADPQSQSAYNAPDALSRMSTPAGYGQAPQTGGMPQMAGGMPQMGGMQRPNPGNPGVSPYQNAAGTMGIAKPSYGRPQRPGMPNQPDQPQMRRWGGAMPPGFAPWV